MAGEFGPRPSSDLGHRTTWRPAGETLLFPKPALATRARARFRLRWAESGRQSRAHPRRHHRRRNNSQREFGRSRECFLLLVNIVFDP